MVGTRGTISLLWAMAISILFVASAYAQNVSPAPGTVRACALECRQDLGSCLNTARANYRSCAQTACSDERAAVQSKCASDTPPSTDCNSARVALRTCLKDSCDRPLISEIGACRKHAGNCVKLCVPADSGPPPSDPECKLHCAKDGLTCLGKARADGQRCQDDCKPILQTAFSDCKTSPTSAICKEDRQAVSACVQDCLQSLQSAARSCAGTATSCAASCASPTPTSQSTASRRR